MPASPHKGSHQMNLELLTKEIARCALNHGYLHLGHCTLAEFIGQELDVNDEQLLQVEKYLDALLGEKK
jgi:hypothetical protein